MVKVPDHVGKNHVVEIGSQGTEFREQPGDQRLDQFAHIQEAGVGFLQPPRTGVRWRIGRLIEGFFQDSCNLGNASIHRDRSSPKGCDFGAKSFNGGQRIALALGSGEFFRSHGQIVAQAVEQDSAKIG